MKISENKGKLKKKANINGILPQTVLVGALLNFISGLLFEKTYLIVIKDETDLKSKLNASTLILIGSYVRKLVASYLQRGR